MVVMKRLSLYSLFDWTPARHSYVAKVLTAALTTTLIPILVLSAALMSGQSSLSMGARVALIAGTLVAAAALTVWGVLAMLRPVKELEGFVDKYLSTGVIADLDGDQDDDLGILMRDTRNAVMRLDLSTKELAEASKVDVLTGLPNRRFCTQRLQQDLARANRTRTPVSLIAVDIDDFHRLNDKYGTMVGDVCLKHFADLTKCCVREGDWIARWGGDEFLILLWDADSRQAEGVINRIRYKLAQSELTHEAGIRLSASFGYTAHAPGDMTFEMFAKADAALYRAKKLGKNQAVGPTGVSAKTA